MFPIISIIISVTLNSVQSYCLGSLQGIVPQCLPPPCVLLSLHSLGADLSPCIVHKHLTLHASRASRIDWHLFEALLLTARCKWVYLSSLFLGPPRESGQKGRTKWRTEHPKLLLPLSCLEGRRPKPAGHLVSPLWVLFCGCKQVAVAFATLVSPVLERSRCVSHPAGTPSPSCSQSPSLSSKSLIHLRKGFQTPFVF